MSLREFRVQTRLNHPNIVKLLRVMDLQHFKTDDSPYHNLCGIMEYCERGDLFGLISESQGFKEEIAHNMFNQLLDGVLYLHSQGVSHRDIKPENIFVT